MAWVSADRVQADVLKMAKTKENRELIKWFYARRVFFFGGTVESLSSGLELARECEHEDARFLVSLFPEGADLSAAAAFQQRSDDARCQCWNALRQEDNRKALLRQSAENGCAMAQAMYGMAYCFGDEQLSWLEKSVLQGDPLGMSLLASALWRKDKSNVRSQLLWRQAAELGHAEAQFYLGKRCCEHGLPEQAIWWRRCVLQDSSVRTKAVDRLVLLAKFAVERHQEGESGRTVFELGAIFVHQPSYRAFCPRSERTATWDTAVALFVKWQNETRRAVWCWLWLARELGVARDVRLLIADEIWSLRSSWGDGAL